jgi:dihydroorotase
MNALTISLFAIKSHINSFRLLYYNLCEKIISREQWGCFAVKLYPAGATEDSQDDVTDIFG